MLPLSTFSRPAPRPALPSPTVEVPLSGFWIEDLAHGLARLFDETGYSYGTFANRGLAESAMKAVRQ